MYCMIARNQVKPGKADATAKALEKTFIPIMKKTPGFREAQVVIGPKGEYTAFLIWDAKAGADVYANSPDRKKALAGLGDLVEGPMKLEFGEVRVSASA